MFNTFLSDTNNRYCNQQTIFNILPNLGLIVPSNNCNLQVFALIFQWNFNKYVLSKYPANIQQICRQTTTK